jgi:hypothetical protein
MPKMELAAIYCCSRVPVALCTGFIALLAIRVVMDCWASQAVLVKMNSRVVGKQQRCQALFQEVAHAR